MSSRLDHDDGRCRRRRRQFVDVSLTILVALALLAQQTSGVGGELAPAADRKSRKRQSATVVPDELAPLSSVEDDPYETEDTEASSNTTSNRRTSADRHHRFDFVNPKPGKLKAWFVYVSNYSDDVDSNRYLDETNLQAFAS